MRHLRLEEKIEEKELEKNKERKKSPGLRLPVARPLSGSQLDQGTSRPPSWYVAEQEVFVVLLHLWK